MDFDDFILVSNNNYDENNYQNFYSKNPIFSDLN